MIVPGMQAPAFSVADDEGRPTTLEQFRGRWVVLYFFPKADTPG
jgi:thioredoxin-dependent peroxiredoxin